MIRPFTFVTMMLAAGAGLYLYSAKHQAQMLDREIGRVVKQAETTRERTEMLRAEWALLNEPDRLAELAKAHLTLKTLAPTQFVAVNDLPARLPSPAQPGALPPQPGTDTEEPAPPPPTVTAQAAPPVLAQATPPAPARPAPPHPAPTPTPTSAPVVAAAEPKPPAPKHVAPQPVAVAAAPLPRPAPVAVAVSAAPASNPGFSPGPIGESVLRTMRANAGLAAAPVAAAAPPYAPAQSYTSPAAYAPVASASLLGGRTSLPPPVPFAAR